jgi:hypothetical protein
MKGRFSFALFVTIAGSACAQEQTATSIVGVGFDCSLAHAASASGGNQLTSNVGVSRSKASREKRHGTSY